MQLEEIYTTLINSKCHSERSEESVNIVKSADLLKNQELAAIYDMLMKGN
jgi:hypothetical protein